MPEARRIRRDEGFGGGFRVQSSAVSAGVSMGTALAMILSWSANKSILLAIIHGFMSWLYVAYFALFKQG